MNVFITPRVCETLDFLKLIPVVARSASRLDRRMSKRRSTCSKSSAVYQLQLCLILTNALFLISVSRFFHDIQR